MFHTATADRANVSPTTQGLSLSAPAMPVKQSLHNAGSGGCMGLGGWKGVGDEVMIK